MLVICHVPSWQPARPADPRRPDSDPEDLPQGAFSPSVLAVQWTDNGKYPRPGCPGLLTAS